MDNPHVTSKVSIGRAIERADEKALYDNAYEKRGKQKPCDRRQPYQAGHHGGIGAQHEKFSVRKIKHVHLSENDAQSKRNQNQDHGAA